MRRTNLLLLPFALGCGQTAEAGTDASVDAATDAAEPDPFARDSGPSRPFAYDASAPVCAPCPEQVPAQLTPCATPGLECEYGNHPLRRCNTEMDCVATAQNGVLWVPGGFPGATGCDPPTTGGQCPASPPPDGAPCEGVSLSLVCGYDSGYCSCIDDGVGPRGWGCYRNPAAPCQRPRLGCPCPAECSETLGTCQIVCDAHAHLECTE